MKIRFLIKRRTSLATHFNVYFGLYERDSIQLIPTGLTATVKEWSKSDNAPKDHNSELSKALVRQRAVLQKVILRMQADEKTLTPATLKNEYMNSQRLINEVQDVVDRRVISDMVTVAKLAKQYNDEQIFRFRKSTQRSVKCSINAFTTYLKSAGLSTITKKQLDDDVITGYDRYMLVKKKMSDNSHGMRMKHLRWFLKTLDFNTSKIKIRSTKKNILSLTLAEMGRLEAVDVSFSIEYTKAKDLFLLGCYTGLRISDLKRLSPANTIGQMISLKTLKNNKDVKIPIISSCDVILKKYNYKSPKLAEHTLNECIKEVCKKALINEATVVETTKAGQRISITKPKYDLITSHIAGKTFITLAPERWGLSPAEIAAIVGKDLRTLLNSYFGDKGNEGRTKMIQMDQAQMKIAK